MPKAELPTTVAGWIVALIASFIGFIIGFVTLALLNRIVGG